MHRLIEERVGLLYRQGRVSGSVYTGRGQEARRRRRRATRSGPTTSARRSTASSPATSRAASPRPQAFRNFLGKGDSPTRGRDGNMHFGVPERGVFPLVSMLGDLCPVIVGAALAFKRRREPRVALTFWGDGAMSTGDVHEGLNLAAVLKVPAVFVLQSNGYAYSTPTSRQMVNTVHGRPHRGRLGHPRDARRRQRRDRDARRAARRRSRRRAAAAGRARSRPSRCALDGHAAHDDGSYMDQEQLAEYVAQRDPDRAARRAPAPRRALGRPRSTALRASAADEVAAGLAEAEASPAPDPATILDGVYATELT